MIGDKWADGIGCFLLLLASFLLPFSLFFYRFLEFNQASVDGGEWDQVEDGILAMDRCAGIGLGRSGTAYGLAWLSAFGLGMGSVW